MSWRVSLEMLRRILIISLQTDIYDAMKRASTELTFHHPYTKFE